MPGLAKNTIHAYGRGANDYLDFCQRTGCRLVETMKADIVAYIDDMTLRPNSKKENIRYLHSSLGYLPPVEFEAQWLAQNLETSPPFCV